MAHKLYIRTPNGSQGENLKLQDKTPNMAD